MELRDPAGVEVTRRSKTRAFRLIAFWATGLSLLAVSVVLAGSNERQPGPGLLACGLYPTHRPLQPGIPTPRVAMPATSVEVAPTPQVGLVGTWASCFRPEVVTIRAGEVVQWQQVGRDSPDVVLEDRTDLGPVRHVLEVRFNRPGRYSYHSRSDRRVAGAVVVWGQARAGAAVERVDGVVDQR